MDKILDFIRKNKYAIVIFSHSQRKEYENVCKAYHIHGAFRQGIALRFEDNRYDGHSLEPDSCYKITGSKAYFLFNCYAVLDFRKSISARVV